jgi:repressor LexA
VKSIPKSAEFALCVSGDSMEPVIKNGALVFVQPQPVAENGEIVIVEVDGAVTCKKFYNLDGRIELRSINPKYKPIVEFENIRIIGKVIM